MSKTSRSSVDELTLLAIGDVHLGTRPSSLPEGLDDAGVDLRALTPEAALLAAVARAIDEGVDGVVFAGDVVESTNARFEAMRPLERAVRELLAVGIPVLAVAGNHDVEALPRLAREIEGFELLGEGGRWQTRLIEKAGGPSVEILGWSFPERQVRNSPVGQLLRDPIPPTQPGLTRIGLLHGDLDASGGNYAPFSSRELVEAGLDAWLLGHIHKPSLSQCANADGEGPRGYLGSLVGLDPTERGVHGPWLVRVDRAGVVSTQQLAMAPLRWERFDVAVDRNEGPEDVGDRILREAVAIGHDLQGQGSAPKVLGLRAHLVGRTRHYDALRRSMTAGEWNGKIRSAGDTIVFIDKVIDHLALAHDLRELARGNDPPALLARKLLILETESDERSALLEQARDALGPLARDARWKALENERDVRDPLAEDAAVVALLTESATLALSALLTEHEADAVNVS